MKYMENAREVATLAPDYMGFIFYPGSPRYVEPKLRIELFEKLPRTIKKVGVFVNETLDNVIEEAFRLKLDLIQLHGAEPPEYSAELKRVGFRVIKAFGMDEGFGFSKTTPYKPHVDFFLFDTKTRKHGGSGKTFDWSILEGYDQEVPFFLSGGLGANDVNRLGEIGHYNVAAIDVNSQFETEPGLKDMAKLKVLKSNLDQFNAGNIKARDQPDFNWKL